MEDDVFELQNEIDLLKKRIALLERKENNRKAFSYVKILVKVLLLLVTIYGAWYGYNYVVNELPKIMEEKIQEIKIVNE